jgi:hypothetical protein
MNNQRQGDLLIEQVSEIKGTPTKSKVLAEGETTGHKHQLKGNQVQVYEFQNEKYVQVLEPAELIHEEHQKLELEPGNYKVTNQREYSYLDNNIRRVAD